MTTPAKRKQMELDIEKLVTIKVEALLSKHKQNGAEPSEEQVSSIGDNYSSSQEQQIESLQQKLNLRKKRDKQRRREIKANMKKQNGHFDQINRQLVNLDARADAIEELVHDQRHQADIFFMKEFQLKVKPHLVNCMLYQLANMDLQVGDPTHSSVVHLQTLCKYLMKVGMSPSVALCAANIELYKEFIQETFSQGDFMSSEELVVKLITAFANMTPKYHHEHCKHRDCPWQQVCVTNAFIIAQIYKYIELDVPVVKIEAPDSLMVYYENQYTKKKPFVDKGVIIEPDSPPPIDLNEQYINWTELQMVRKENHAKIGDFAEQLGFGEDRWDQLIALQTKKKAYIKLKLEEKGLDLAKNSDQL